MLHINIFRLCLLCLNIFLFSRDSPSKTLQQQQKTIIFQYTPMRLDPTNLPTPYPTISAADPERVPEDYYSYLEGWYRSQVKAASQAAKTGGSLPSLHSSVPTSFPYIPPTATATASSSTSQLTVSLAGSGGNHHPGLFIPVAALQGLRSSLPGQLPQLTTGMAVVRNTRTHFGHQPFYSIFNFSHH
jgi:hypothetical protein